MENMLECAFIVLWLQLGCKLQVKRWDPKGTFSQRWGGEREEFRHCSSQALCWNFQVLLNWKLCVVSDFVFLNRVEWWDRVEQSPQTLRIQEGVSISLNCSYTVSNFRGLQWYRQDPGKGPELLFLLYSVGDEKQEERLRATLLKKGSSLLIGAPKPEDSATYLCAVETQCSPGTCRLYPNLEAAALE